jgi:cysteine desulfurase / selenocysteine lyase
MRQIYLNNAATSYPKPATVVAAVAGYFSHPPEDPGRDAGGCVDPRESCRALLARALGVGEPRQVILLPSATCALNLVVQGLQGPGRHFVTTALEHNSLLRPLAHAARDHGAGLTTLEPDARGLVSGAAVRAALSPRTCLIAVSHASNVTGSVQPIEEIADAAARAGVPLLVDASQSAGCIPLDHSALPGRVLVVFTGHKGLLGPPGVGGLVVPDDEVPQVIVGGTGFDSVRPTHPEGLPVRHEAGTPNWPGIAGLSAGVEHVLARGVAAEGAHRAALAAATRVQLERLSGVVLAPTANGDLRAGIVSFTVSGLGPEEVGFALKSSFGVTTRAGLHCAPLAHRHLGTAPLGTVRASFGWANTVADVAVLVDGIRALAGGA